MMKPLVLMLAAAAIALSVSHKANAADAKAFDPSKDKPNIIFVLADDLGNANVGCYGGDHVTTPNIDALAQRGTRYTNAYTAPLCGPSRSLIMTGRYAFRTGATNQDATGEMKPENETMMPRVLKPAGYVTSHIGKWGQLPLGPSEFGFDDTLSFKGSGVYWNVDKKRVSYTENGASKTLDDKQYMPDVMHDHLVGFLQKHTADPFYIYYCMSHIHGDIVPTPDSAPNTAAGSKQCFDDNIAYMDKLVGKLMSELDRLKLLEKTLVIFIGDNGTGQGWADYSTIGGKRLSGQKGSMLEGGALVPMVAYWPGVVPAGRVSHELIDSTDFFPTFAELAGTKVPEGKKIDGRSFVAQLKGQPGKSRDWIFIELARQWYVREANWKLTQAGELFDMSGAPFVEKPVAAQGESADAAAARQRLAAVLKELNPAGGILDQGDGSGRHAKKNKDKGKSDTKGKSKKADE